VAEEYIPATHKTQADAAVVADDFPNAQLVQEVAPKTENAPAAHVPVHALVVRPVVDP
jgi:hypothetical protein